MASKRVKPVCSYCGGPWPCVVWRLGFVAFICFDCLRGFNKALNDNLLTLEELAHFYEVAQKGGRE